jgi:hypothetical protein
VTFPPPQAPVWKSDQAIRSPKSVGAAGPRGARRASGLTGPRGALVEQASHHLRRTDLPLFGQREDHRQGPLVDIGAVDLEKGTHAGFGFRFKEDDSCIGILSMKNLVSIHKKVAGFLPIR